MDLGLTDRVYLVTGGARGLGRATADVLVAEGARVVLSGRTEETLAAVRGESVETVVADNADPATPQRLLDAAQARWGRVDGALVSVGGPPKGPVTGITDEHGWRPSGRSSSAPYASAGRSGVRFLRAARSRSCCPRACVRRWPTWPSPTACGPDWRWWPRRWPTSSALRGCG